MKKLKGLIYGACALIIASISTTSLLADVSGPYVGIQASINGLEITNVPMKRGETLIWSAGMLHGGSKVFDETLTRYSQVTHYHFSDCKYYTPNFSDRKAGKIAYRDVIDYDISKN